MIIGDQTGRRIVFTESDCSCCIEKIDENAYYYDGMDPGDGTEYPYMIVFHSDEDCTAYQSKQENTGLITVDKAIRYARNGVNSMRGGYSAYDVYASIDFDGETMSLGDVLERLTK